MNTKFSFLLLLVCAFFLVACETQKTENVSVNQNKSASNQTSVNSANTANSLANETANTNDKNDDNKTNSEMDADDDKSDFAGTAGITDKKTVINGAAILKEVRTAQHENYDRVVFEFAGAEMPSYHIEYVDKPVRACGSGKVVSLAGDGWLGIRFNPANAHTEEGKPTIEKREQPPNFKIIKEMKLTCDFEAEVEWVLGVASPNKYRVLELKNPTRMSIDIKH